MKKITTITPLLFDNYLIIGFDAKWTALFNHTIPAFDVMINKDGNLCLISKQKVKNNGNAK